MIPERATKLLMELSIYNEVEKELAKQNKLNDIPDDYTAAMTVMRISWSATSKGGTYWSHIHTQLENMEMDEHRLSNPDDYSDGVLSVF